MSNITIRQAICVCFPDSEQIEIYDGGTAASFRDWSYSKEIEDVTYDEVERENVALAKLRDLLPNWSFGRDDKNYFGGYSQA